MFVCVHWPDQTGGGRCCKGINNKHSDGWKGDFVCVIAHSLLFKSDFQVIQDNHPPTLHTHTQTHSNTHSLDRRTSFNCFSFSYSPIVRHGDDRWINWLIRSRRERIGCAGSRHALNIEHPSVPYKVKKVIFHFFFVFNSYLFFLFWPQFPSPLAKSSPWGEQLFLGSSHQIRWRTEATCQPSNHFWISNHIRTPHRPFLQPLLLSVCSACVSDIGRESFKIVFANHTRTMKSNFIWSFARHRNSFAFSVKNRYRLFHFDSTFRLR